MSEVDHIVLLQPRTDVSVDEVDVICREIAEQRGHVPGLLALTVGPDVSVERLSDGYTRGIVMRFATAQARDDYLASESHRALGARIGSVVERALVFDIAR